MQLEQRDAADYVSSRALVVIQEQRSASRYVPAELLLPSRLDKVLAAGGTSQRPRDLRVPLVPAPVLIALLLQVSLLDVAVLRRAAHNGRARHRSAGSVWRRGRPRSDQAGDGKGSDRCEPHVCVRRARTNKTQRNAGFEMRSR